MTKPNRDFVSQAFTEYILFRRFAPLFCPFFSPMMTENSVNFVKELDYKREFVLTMHKFVSWLGSRHARLWLTGPWRIKGIKEIREESRFYVKPFAFAFFSEDLRITIAPSSFLPATEL